MKRKLFNWSRQYQSALRAHLEKVSHSSLQSAQGLGSRALAAGLQPLDIARIHEQTLVTKILPACPPGKRAALIRHAGVFFAIAITPIETHRGAREEALRLKQFVQTLSQRTVELTALNMELSLEIAQRKAVEAALKKSKLHYSQLLEQSDSLQDQLRQLSRQVLSAQEDERKKISRELHDVIAQTLAGINVQLAALKKAATLNTDDLERDITRTQQLVQHSVDIVHRFARELRPTVLDDLGLIPALLTFMKNLRKETGIQISLSAYATVEQVSGDKRTVLYRVAQEALTNVARHARASKAEVKIQKLDGALCMKIKDNGNGFKKDSVLRATRNKRLGLLGMRERLEMVGGSFRVTSAPGKGTCVEAQIPFEASPLGQNGKAPRPFADIPIY